MMRTDAVWACELSKSGFPPQRGSVRGSDGRNSGGIMEPLLPRPSRRPDGRGRPWRDPRDVLHGILWMPRTGASWKDLPDRYRPYQTSPRRFQQWCRTEPWSGCSKRWLGTSSSVARSISPSALSMAPSAGRKRGLRRREDQAREGHQGHGSCRRRWSSYRHPALPESQALLRRIV